MEKENAEISKTKKYFWLKLKDNFFEEKYIKLLRKQENGDKMVIIYMKMQLKSLKNEGYIYYEELESTPLEELALDIDEDVDIVKITVDKLIEKKIVEKLKDETLYLVKMKEVIGKEDKSAERVRKHRSSKKEKMLQSNAEPLQCNTEIEKDIEINIDKNIEIEREVNTDISADADAYNKKFIKPSLKEIEDFCFENQINIDCDYFLNYYQSNGWKVGRNPMKDWRATIHNWNKNSFNSPHGIATVQTNKTSKYGQHLNQLFQEAREFDEMKEQRKDDN